MPLLRLTHSARNASKAMISNNKRTFSGSKLRSRRSPISVRLPIEEEAFYREEAGKAKMTLTAFITKRLIAGAILETGNDFEERVRTLIAEIPSLPTSSLSGLDRASQLSLFTCEALLTAIVQAQNPKTVQAAQDAAKARLLKVRGEAG